MHSSPNIRIGKSFTWSIGPSIKQTFSENPTRGCSSLSCILRPHRALSRLCGAWLAASLVCGGRLQAALCGSLQRLGLLRAAPGGEVWAVQAEASLALSHCCAPGAAAWGVYGLRNGVRVISGGSRLSDPLRLSEQLLELLKRLFCRDKPRVSTSLVSWKSGCGGF